jgi:hypothetical protein
VVHCMAFIARQSSAYSFFPLEQGWSKSCMHLVSFSFELHSGDSAWAIGATESSINTAARITTKLFMAAPTRRSARLSPISGTWAIFHDLDHRHGAWLISLVRLTADAANELLRRYQPNDLRISRSTRKAPSV